ncbi:MAG TPA: HTTM domain-containing protein [Kofleriaceae bacterium]
MVARVAAALMFVSQLLLHRSIWLDRSLPLEAPTLPLFRWLPSLPEPLGTILWAAMLAGCCLVVLGVRARAASIGVAVGYAVMAILDQTRWQAHFIVGPVMMLLVTLPAPAERDSLRNVRFAIASIYFFAGLAKLNVSYATLVHPAMLAPLIERAPSFLAPMLAFPWLPPLTEMAVGIATFSPGAWKTRRFVVVAVLGMHAFILTMLLIGGEDWAVLPFNGGLAALAVASLLDRADPQAVAKPSFRMWGGRLSLLYGIVLPLLSLIGLADLYFHGYYAGNEARIRWFASPAAAERLLAIPWPPASLVDGKLRLPRIAPGMRSVGDGQMLNVPFHALVETMGQGVMGEARIADRVKERLCEFAAREPDDIVVRFFGVADPITGDRMYRDANCAETLGFWLRLGGFSTIVIGGDEPVYRFEQHGNPTF